MRFKQKNFCKKIICPLDYSEYTDFEKMEKNLGQNCSKDKDLLLSFLKDMLHSDKRKRKTPKELLTHEFIRIGERYVDKERKRLKKQKESKTKIEVNIKIFTWVS